MKLIGNKKQNLYRARVFEIKLAKFLVERKEVARTFV